jgi:hypothetical protein
MTAYQQLRAIVRGHINSGEAPPLLESPVITGEYNTAYTRLEAHLQGLYMKIQTSFEMAVSLKTLFCQRFFKILEMIISGYK